VGTKKSHFNRRQSGDGWQYIRPIRRLARVFYGAVQIGSRGAGLKDTGTASSRDAGSAGPFSGKSFPGRFFSAVDDRSENRRRHWTYIRPQLSRL